MKPTKLYKKGCDPYVVTSTEALDYHLAQGWFEDEAELDKEPAPVVTIKPYNVLDEVVSCTVTSDEVKGLTEALAAKDAIIAEMQTDFEDTFTGMNAVITGLKQQLVDAGLTPAAPASRPAAPVEGPTNQQLRDQLDAAGIKHTPRDNKTSLLALIETIPR